MANRTDVNPAAWDQMVLDTPGATIFHLAAWTRVLAETYGFRSLPLSLTDEHREVVGILPLSLVDSPFTGRRLVSLPCTNSAGPICRETERSTELVSAAVALAREEKCRYLEIRGQPESGMIDLPGLVRLDYYGSFLLDLEPDHERLKESFEKRARRGVAKARKSGVHVRFGTSLDDLRQFYRLNLMTRRKHGVPPQPLRFFDKLWTGLRSVGDVELVIAEVDGQAVAGIILLGFRETATYAYGASDPRYLRYSPNHALFDTAIAWAVEHGYRRFDFGRTAPDNRGLVEFKRQWGSHFVPLSYFYWPTPDGFVADSEAGARHRAFTALWRRLPLAVTAWLGPSLYRHLA